MQRLLVTIALALAVLWVAAPPAAAHQSAVKYIDIELDGARATVRFTVSPSDVTEPLGLPPDAQPGVAAAVIPGVAEYVQRWLALALPDGAACPASEPMAMAGPDLGFVLVAWEARCPGDATPARLRVDLTRFFAVDQRHEAIVTVHVPGEHGEPQIFRAGEPVGDLQLGERASLAGWIGYGMDHIYGGPDHVCFVLALLLVVVIGRRGAADWEARRPLAAVRSTAAIVTAFTVAHSLSLIAASLGYVRLPSRLVESLIAASILYTAIENVVRPDARWRFGLTFAFGLIHGLGFASMLEELLPPTHVIAPLLGFNLGVELGQLSIVAVALPVCWGLARLLGAETYRRYVLPIAGAPLVLVGIKWLVERVFDVSTFTVWGL